ncbi:DNA adenine methylase [Empedobacter brevis]|uniref:DNA adenine methylase n=1 Tax=Empedobacter brevis TaxID=247 RepID=UPI00289687B0|nr:DNA adenine methylase [Empedobacter brevis]
MKIDIAKPFLKWAGGKTQLLNEINDRLPNNFENESITFFEPFLGSGAVMFWTINKFPNIEKFVVNDINTDLINTYNVIKNNHIDLITELLKLQNDFHSFEHESEEKKLYFYDKRQLYNKRLESDIVQASLFIFLNRTCFNGLYRVNSKGEFNVPMGSYKQPLICDAENLIQVHKALQKVILLNGDYQEVIKYRGEKNFFYFDPPYKPLSESSSFNSYAKDDFNDKAQIHLKEFTDTLHKLGDKWMLSNSDVKGADENNNFFDELYNNYIIKRVFARRNINSKSEKRGKLTELLITNY